MNLKDFYEKHRNFSERTITEYYISPGIRCKFDIIKDLVDKLEIKGNMIDLGASGNSILYFLDNLGHKTFLDVASLPLRYYHVLDDRVRRKFKKQLLWHCACAEITSLPFRNNSFHLITALDVLEHVKNDKSAIEEIGRILQKKGYLIITVPHRMKYYTPQDKLIGHYRRYEIEPLKKLICSYNMKHLGTFGVYGQFMRIADIQSINPQKTEENLTHLRERYITDEFFRKVWNVAVKIWAKLMRLDAKYVPLNKMMNIGLLFQKK